MLNDDKTNINCVYNKFNVNVYNAYITEVEKLAVDFVKDIAGKYADDFQGLKKTLTPDLALKLDTCLTVNTAVNGHS